MLYNDDDEPSKNRLGSDFLPVAKNKLSSLYISKLSVTIIIFVVLAIVVIFNIVYSAIEVKSNENAKELVQDLYANEVRVADAEGNVEQKEETNVNENPGADIIENPGSEVTVDVVQGTHPTLAAHDITGLLVNRKLPQQIENAQEVIKNLYYQPEKWVFLTFDDGPTTTITPQVLETLKNENVKATFFVLGKMVERNPELLRQEYDEGHYIANHSYSHEYAQVYASPETTWDEFNRTEDAIRVALNNPDYHSYLFRFPGGSAGGKYASIKASAKEIFNSNNIGTVNWNALSGDAEGANTSEKQMENVRTTSEGDDTVILLMHDAYDKQVTADTLPEIIHYYKDLGYEFKTFYDVFK